MNSHLHVRTCGLQPHHQRAEQKDRDRDAGVQLPFTDPTASQRGEKHNKFHGA